MNNTGRWAAENVMVNEDGSPRAARLWTSSLLRTRLTARHIPHPKIEVNGSEWINMRPKAFRVLDEIYAGLCDGMTYDEIANAYPDEAVARKADKFRYRYPRGESYTDLIARLEPIAHEIERLREPVTFPAILNPTLTTNSRPTFRPHSSFHPRRQPSPLAPTQVLIVAHQAIHRVLYAYFMGYPREECMSVSIPLNTVIRITPTARG